nr:hypothetical protein [Opitutaceae bacterium]
MKFLPQLSIFAVLAAGSLSGQNARTSSTPETQDETPIVLSPFEVSADEDVGYEARETLAGGRTRTSLDDIAN